MINEKQIKDFFTQGYLHLEGFLERSEVELILLEAKEVFVRQFQSKKYIDNITASEISLAEFDAMLIKLYEEDFQTLVNCGKQIQHLICLHRLSLSQKIVDLLMAVGFKFPNISTRPVLYFNHPKLAKEKVFYKVDAHQDWRSMQGSLNSMVIWTPLMDIDKSIGALELLPKSHLLGLVTNNVDHGFGMVNLNEAQQYELETVEVKAGDILLFSSFLVHQSGENISDTPRWSCHFRYNDLGESTFIERGYPHAYLYKPVDTLLTDNFPTQKQINNTFNYEPK